MIRILRYQKRSSTAVTSEMEHFVIVNDWKPLTIITESSILDVAAVLDPPLQWFLKTWLYEILKILKSLLHVTKRS